MDDQATTNTEKPRKLLRWVDHGPPEQPQEPENQCDGAQECLQRTSSTSSDGPDTSTPGRREEWYEAKFKRLRETVGRLRKEMSDKERDYLRLKNKYTTTRRRQDQLQEEINKSNEIKLDKSSEVEFLKLQLLEREKEVARYKEMESGDERLENGGNAQPDADRGREDCVSNGGMSLESCIAGSFLERKYLNLHKDVRRKVLYGVFGFACFLSVFALSVTSPFLSTMAVGCWTFGLACLWNERKELFRVMKLNHLKQLREVTSKNFQLRQEKAKLESVKQELEGKISEESREKDDAVGKVGELSAKIVAETTKSGELVKKERAVYQELESERVSRRLAEQRLQELSTQQSRNPRDEATNTNVDDCEEIAESLRLERAEKEKLNRENERLIKEIVSINTKEEKWALEKAKLGAQLAELQEKLKNGDQVDGEEMSCSVSASTEVSSNLKHENLLSNLTCPISRCWLCAWKIPRETRVFVYVFAVACLLAFVKFAVSSKTHMLVSSVSVAAATVYSFLQLKKRSVKTS